MKKLITVIFLLLATFGARASHLVGGDMTMQHLHGYTYKLTLEVFRDCEHGVPWFNDDVVIGMFDRTNNALVNRIDMGNYVSNDTLVFVAHNCIRIPTGCTHVGTYIDSNLVLDPNKYNSPAGYYFSWLRCCRNTIIRNIVTGSGGGETGEVWYMEIPPLNTVNSTPVFKKSPLTLLCVSNPFTFDYDCHDADGDSLVYSLVIPLRGNTGNDDPNDLGTKTYPGVSYLPERYKTVNYKAGYSQNGNIMDASPSLSIDPHTGQLTCTPRREGVYVVAIRVEEYRHGRRLGEIHRELQLTISSCATNHSPQYNDSANNRTYVIHATDTLQFDINIHDGDHDSVYFSSTGTVFPGSTRIKPPYATLSEGSGKGRADYHSHFYWATTCGQATKDTQYVNFTTVDNGCPIHRTSISRIKIMVLPTPPPLPPNVICLDRIDTNQLRINFGRVDFSKYFKLYLLIRKNPDSTETVIDTITKTHPANPYVIDKKAYDNMHKFYKYYFVGIDICGDTGIKSYNVYSDPKYPRQPASRYITTATVRDSAHVLIEWQAAGEEDFLSYILYRKSDAPKDTFENYKVIYNRKDTSFLDSAVNVQAHSYCYEILAASKCGFVSKTSNRACTILLHGSSEPFQSILKWNPYHDWKGGIAYYTIVRKDPATAFDSINYELPSPFLSFVDDKLDIDWGIYWYKVIAHEGSGSSNAISVSNEIQLIQSPVVYAPNCFTPNADGLNDDWSTVPVFVKDFDVKIYNRWGEKVFEADRKHQGWTGQFSTARPAADVFIYQLTYTGWDKSTHFMTGNITILK